MNRRSLFCFIVRSGLIATLLSGSQMAMAAGPWGTFGPVASYGQRNSCFGNASYYFLLSKYIKSELFVTHGWETSPSGVVTRRYEAIYSINRSASFYPNIDVGVLSTNDTLAGSVPRATSTSDNDRQAIEVTGEGINLIGTCRVRPS